MLSILKQNQPLKRPDEQTRRNNMNKISHRNKKSKSLKILHGVVPMELRVGEIIADAKLEAITIGIRTGEPH